MLLDEAGTLHEHATGTGRGIEDLALEGLDDFNDQADDGRGSEVLAALGALSDGELTEEVFVNATEGVTVKVAEDGVHRPKQADQGRIRECLICPGQNAAQLLILFLNRGHGVVDGLPQVRSFWKP